VTPCGILLPGHQPLRVEQLPVGPSSNLVSHSRFLINKILYSTNQQINNLHQNRSIHRTNKDLLLFHADPEPDYYSDARSEKFISRVLRVRDVYSGSDFFYPGSRVAKIPVRVKEF
jgi:hypothetical protein